MRCSALEWGVACFLLLAPCGCGSRTELAPPDGLPNGAGGSPPVVACTTDTDCPPANACGSFRCLAERCEFEAISCDDKTPCTEDTCDPTSGCEHRFLSLDMDGDKHRSPRPGFEPGTDVCGDDCDDTNPNAFPGNTEVCDGVDNDCDRVVDNGFSYQRSGAMPVRVAPAAARRSRRDDGGITATPEAFVITYSSLEDRWISRLQGLSSSGAPLFQSQVSEVNSDTFAGALAWSGKDLATAWSDAHQAGDYEIYSRLFDARGNKQKPALRLTEAEGFSLHPSLKWNQSEYVLAFDDRRGVGDTQPRIFAQRLAPDGSQLGRNILLVGDHFTSEYPSLALSPRRVGLAYSFTQGPDDHAHLGFRAFDAALSPIGNEPALVGENVDTLTLVFVKDRFIALWDFSDGATQGNAIWGAAFDESGTLISKQAVTSGADFARSVAALSLGDRFLMMWADDADTAPGFFELYFQVLDAAFRVLTPRQRFTFSKEGSLMPGLSAGPDGKIGVAFESLDGPSRHVYFSTLQCALTP